MIYAMRVESTLDSCHAILLFLFFLLLPFLLPDFRSVNEVIPRRKKEGKLPIRDSTAV